MAAYIKYICALAFLIQSITANFGYGEIYDNGYFGYGYPMGGEMFGYGPERFGYGGCGYEGGYGNYGGYGGRTILDINSLATSRGSGLVITSRSPIAPTGVTLQSDNSIMGDISVTGTLPFLAAVGFDGALPNGGCGTVSYNCGDGAAGMMTEERFGSGYGHGAGYGVGFGAGYGGDYGGDYGVGYGVGCGADYGAGYGGGYGGGYGAMYGGGWLLG